MELPFKLEACLSISEDDRHKCPISFATVPFLMQMGHAEELFVLYKIKMQSSCLKHAKHDSCKLQFGLCLKLIGLILAENQVSHFLICPTSDSLLKMVDGDPLCD